MTGWGLGMAGSEINGGVPFWPIMKINELTRIRGGVRVCPIMKINNQDR